MNNQNFHDIYGKSGEFVGLSWQDVVPFHDWLTHFGGQNEVLTIATLQCRIHFQK